MSVRVAVRVAEPWELKSIFEAHFEDRIHDLEDRIHRQVVLRMLRSTILLRMLRSTNHPLRPSHRPPGGKCLGNPPRPGRAAGRIHQLLAALGAVAASMAVGSSAGTGDRSWLRGEQLRSAQPRGLQLEPQVEGLQRAGHSKRCPKAGGGGGMLFTSDCLGITPLGGFRLNRWDPKFPNLKHHVLGLLGGGPLQRRSFSGAICSYQAVRPGERCVPGATETYLRCQQDQILGLGLRQGQTPDTSIVSEAGSTNGR